MQKVYLTPGPSQLYQTVPSDIKSAIANNIFSISHRSSQFQNIYQDTVNSLKELLSIPDNYQVFFLASATEAMERIIQNCVKKSSFHFVNGAFSQNFWQIAKNLGKEPQKNEVPYGRAFDFSKITLPKQTELICLTHNETSTGTMLSLSDIYALKNKNREKLIALDIVSSVPFVNVNFKYTDLVFFSVQKGFGLPAGLGVLIVSPKAFAKAQELFDQKYPVGSFHSFVNLNKYGLKNQTPETPNVLAIYLLGKVIGNMQKKGLTKIRRETEMKAGILYQYFDKHQKFHPFVKDKKARSKTVIAVDVKGNAPQIIQKLAKNGLVVGSGYKEYKTNHIRIANFPAHKLKDMHKLVKLI